MFTLEKTNTSPLCILCPLMPQIIPLRTLKLVHTWYEESNPQVILCQKSSGMLWTHHSKKKQTNYGRFENDSCIGLNDDYGRRCCI